MALEQMISLPKAAQILGISVRTMKRRLRVHLGLQFENLPRGSKYLIKESDVEAIARIYSPRQDWTLLRTAGRKSSKKSAA